MKMLTYKKALVAAVAVMLMAGMVLAGCSGSKGGDTTASGKKKVNVWYLWGGKEGEVLEQVIKKFNESQSKYEAVGLSVPDEQKIKVAIAGGNGPDITDSFASNVANYAKEGIALQLDDLIKRDNYDLSDYIPASLEQAKYEGKFYALPLNVMTSGMFYNKKLLAEAGYTEPPKTSKELLEMSIKLTKTNSDGTIEVLGFPSYPAFPFQTLAYGFGGQYLSQDGKQSAFDSPANLEALKVIYEYNKKFDVDNIKQIQATGKWLDPTDPFMSGKQAIRFDGSWLSSFMANNNITLDYGVAPLPYLDGHPEFEGSAENQSAIFYIAKNSKNVDGAWEFMKFLYSKEGMAQFLGGIGNIPSRKSVISDPIFDKVADAREFMKFAENKNVKSAPNVAQLPDILNKVVKEEAEAVFNLKKTPEDGIKAMQQRTEQFLK